MLGVVQELGYESSLVARSLRSHRTHVIGILVAEFEPFSAEILKGVGAALRHSRYEVLAYAGTRDGVMEGWERRSLFRLSGTLIDGAVLVTPSVVDVDVELGLVRVVALDTAQDVGKALNPQAVIGQIQGGSAQGMGLAVMEELVVTNGLVRNPSFTDYLIPTILDMPPMRIEVLEYADPHAPYGVRGVGEPPAISSGPAVAAAIRQAVGRPLRRVPIRPEHITGT